jgi:hypothetical protein
VAQQHAADGPLRGPPLMLSDILQANIWIHRPVSPSIPSCGILTKSHKGLILRVFVGGTAKIQGKIYRVLIARP